MTIKDLSRETGYSVGTISRVLNDQPNVSEKARKAILAIVEERGFQLNANAKNLSAATALPPWSRERPTRCLRRSWSGFRRCLRQRRIR